MTYPPSGEQYRSPQESYPQQQSSSEYYQPQQQAPYYPPQGQYAPPQQGYGQPQYPPQGQYGQQPPYGQPYQQPVYGVPMNQAYGMVKNARAGRAMFYGILSVVLGMLTLFTLVGFAGIITGSFAVFYGFTALNASKTLPNNVGRGKALTGIILGFVAIGLVILSFIIRTGASGS